MKLYTSLETSNHIPYCSSSLAAQGLTKTICLFCRLGDPSQWSILARERALQQPLAKVCDGLRERLRHHGWLSSHMLSTSINDFLTPGVCSSRQILPFKTFIQLSISNVIIPLSEESVAAELRSELFVGERHQVLHQRPCDRMALGLGPGVASISDILKPLFACGSCTL